MKKIIFSILLVNFVLLLQAQSISRYICRIGFTYEISRSNNWGKNKPVVLTVTPYSSAETAGIQPNDIIESIDGVLTTAVAPEEIPQLLNPAGKNQFTLVIKNQSNPSREVIIKKECKKTNALTEECLALAYGMYSPETTGERIFTCPFCYTVPADTDFSGFKTYAFTLPAPGNEALEKMLNEYISKELTHKGLTPTDTNPDLLIQTFYFFDKNPKYQGESKIVIRSEPEYRYNVFSKKMEKFPFLPVSSSETAAKYLLQFGIRFIDRRNPDIDKLQVVWECEANELLAAPYKLEDYARIFVPLMCWQYPYVQAPRNVTFGVEYKTYNYTGISYNIDRMEQVVHVDAGSPALAAGVKKQDIIERINGYSLQHTPEEFTAAYKKFIAATLPYRDRNTLFTDANGFRYGMYWDKLRYPAIADELKNEAYLPAFSYLYYFAPYVNPAETNSCNFLIKRGNNRLELTVRPVIRTSVALYIL